MVISVPNAPIHHHMMGPVSPKMEKKRKCPTWHWRQAHQIMFPGGRYRRYHLVASWSSGSEHLCGSGSLNELPRAQNLKQPVRNSSPIGIHDFTLFRLEAREGTRLRSRVLACAFACLPPTEWMPRGFGIPCICPGCCQPRGSWALRVGSGSEAGVRRVGPEAGP